MKAYTYAHKWQSATLLINASSWEEAKETLTLTVADRDAWTLVSTVETFQ